MPPAMSIRDWVEAGGALMTMVAGVGETHMEECEGANGWTADLGILYDCAHRAPWGPVTALGDSPIAAGLDPANVPFVNGRWVMDAPGSESEVIAYAGTCDPTPVADCRKPLLPWDTAGGDDVPVDVVSIEGRVNSVEAAPGDPVELHVIGIYEAPVDGGEVRVRVDRQASMVLVLASYDPVHWVVEAGDGADIRQVFISGYRDQTAEVPGGIPVEIRVLTSTGEWWNYGYGDDCGGGDTPDLIGNAEAASGLLLRSFHGCYRTGSVTFIR